MNLIKSRDMTGTYNSCVGVGKLKDDYTIHLCVELGYTNKVSLVIGKDGYRLFMSYAEDVSTVGLKFTAAKVIGANQSETAYSAVFDFLKKYCVGEFYVITESKRTILDVGNGGELTW